MVSKVNRKGASCYIISQYRNRMVFYISYILKKQKKIGKNNTYAKYNYIFAGTNL